MKQTVDRFIEKHGLLSAGAKVLAAVSGGPDSAALLHYLVSRKEELGLRLLVLHVDHGLRGAASRQDRMFVETLSRSHGVQCITAEPDVKKEAEKSGTSLQEAARYCRYRFFEQVMNEYEGDYLVTAHHGDDQVETMLMRQVRGAAGGMKGIPVKRPFAAGILVRPFLAVEKDSLIAYCRENGIEYRIDPTNEKDSYTRNRFRKEVLPFLKEENPKVHERFQQQSEWLAEDDDFLGELAEEGLEKAVTGKNPEQVTLSIPEFLSMPNPLQRRAFHLILNYLSKDTEKSMARSIHMNAFSDLLRQTHPSGNLDLPGAVSVRRSYGVCVISSGAESPGRNTDSWQLPESGMVVFKEGKIEVSNALSEEYSSPVPESLWTYYGDRNLLRLPLTVRFRKAGDRLVPFGMTGSRKLKDLLIDKKVPRDLRDRWPVITDADDRILWLPGLARAACACLTESTETALSMTFIPDDPGFKKSVKGH
ncbi:tRNA lysidine(34) synthetase TilS [Alteribacter natronophilus]|uniref:tRNA lysidine(34) synthetase TilS n=1 Tax=Alteribacter natronophilus TaxID=2583810 RepID=UPI00110E6DEF|nr:tRNA lysidine(34) synthetase TilS [Alteribacter natronophilus]TMW69941.1 tRNA lysidine(34) synthetase TilS [Alteribacter natronophilus]